MPAIQFSPNATALTIAGSDPSGGAGLQADLKTFQQLGVYGMSVITLLTVQNTQAVTHVEVLPASLIRDQLNAVLTDIPPRAIKTGALGSADVVRTVSENLKDVSCPVVVDPVLVSKHGHVLVTDDVVEAYRTHLLPLAFMVTPNRFEAERLTGITLSDEHSVAMAIKRLQHFGARNVLIKLGEVSGRSHHWMNGENPGSRPEEARLFESVRMPTNNTHGTGCILAATITAKLALGETRPHELAAFAIQRVSEAVAVNTHLGHGIHPAEIRAMSRGDAT